MVLAGAKGERITELEVTFKTHQDGERIIGLLFRTSTGREHDVVSWRAFTNEPPPAATISDRLIKCGPHEEIVGFEYLIGVSTYGFVVGATELTANRLVFIILAS